MAGYQFVNPRYHGVVQEGYEGGREDVDLYNGSAVPITGHGHRPRSGTFPHGQPTFGPDLRRGRRRSIGILPSASVFGAAQNNNDNGIEDGGRENMDLHSGLEQTVSITGHHRSRSVTFPHDREDVDLYGLEPAVPITGHGHRSRSVTFPHDRDRENVGLFGLEPAVPITGHISRSGTLHHAHGPPILRQDLLRRGSRRRSVGILPSASVFGAQWSTSERSISPGRQYRRHSHVNIAESATMAMHFLKTVPIDPAPSTREMTSSTSSEESLSDAGGTLKDPYKVTLHYITNPGESVRLRKLLEPLIKCFDPSFKLFNIAERSRSNGILSDTFNISEIEYPALSVVLFLLQDDDADDNVSIDKKLDKAQEHLCKRPWQRHHYTCTGNTFAICRQNSQDFYSTGNDLPLWAVRQVHHGKEHLRFMIYSSYARWGDMVQFYSLLVGRKAEYERDDFCYFLIHSKEHMDIQLALKKVPHGCHPRALNSAFLQLKVREIGELVPLLPNACSPISPQRWQTNDPDGNVTLLLVNRKQLGSMNNNQGKPRLLLRQQSTDVLQTLIAPKALRPMSRLSPRLHLSPVNSDENEDDDSTSS